MLEELLPTRQIPGEPPRRWFASDDLDLIVWCRDDGTPIGFQLCYDKRGNERAITWKPAQGFRHTAVDDGERFGASHKASPILVADGVFDATFVEQMFIYASGRLPPAVTEFVANAIRMHPNYIAQG